MLFATFLSSLLFHATDIFSFFFRWLRFRRHAAAAAAFAIFFFSFAMIAFLLHYCRCLLMSSFAIIIAYATTPAADAAISRFSLLMAAALLLISAYLFIRELYAAAARHAITLAFSMPCRYAIADTPDTTDAVTLMLRQACCHMLPRHAASAAILRR